MIDDVTLDAEFNNSEATLPSLPNKNLNSFAVSENPLINDAKDDSVVSFEKDSVTEDNPSR